MTKFDKRIVDKPISSLIVYPLQFLKELIEDRNLDFSNTATFKINAIFSILSIMNDELADALMFYRPNEE